MRQQQEKAKQSNAAEGIAIKLAYVKCAIHGIDSIPACKALAKYFLKRGVDALNPVEQMLTQFSTFLKIPRLFREIFGEQLI